MTTLEEFTRNAAKRYLQNIVFVDDEIYDKPSGHPVEITSVLPAFKSPFAKSASQQAPENGATVVAPVPYHPKQLVGSFAKEGMVCALYEPSEGFPTDKDSEVFKLCERADVVIFDWDLFREDGNNILPLIKNLVDSSQSSVPHHVRLCVIYTTKPELDKIANAIYENLKNAGLEIEPVQESLTLVAGATRIIVLGKPNVPNRTAENKLLEVPEENLADRVIDEFAKMNRGILPSYALHGMSSIRRNSKKILDNFHSDMDGAFLLHRALVIADGDAFDQLPELLAEEVLAVILDDQIESDKKIEISREAASKLKLNDQELVWTVTQGRPARQPSELARMYLGGGMPAVKDECSPPKASKLVTSLHSAMGCEQSNAEKKLATLFNVRTQYKSKAPVLGFGTIVRTHKPEDGDATYAICLMPLCDSIRLEFGNDKATAFPFWTLEPVKEKKNGRGIVVSTPDHLFVELLASGKPRDMLWIEKFAADQFRTVPAITANKSYWFQGERFSLEWVAQLKPAHAQRIAHDIGQKFSRVGVVEAEWLRLLTD